MYKPGNIPWNKGKKSKQIKINGIVWDRIDCDNQTSTMQHCYDVKELLDIVSRRLPTKKEIVVLMRKGTTWDRFNLGVWLGSDSHKKDESKHSLFLPITSRINLRTQEIDLPNTSGWYWIQSDLRDKLLIFKFDYGFATITDCDEFKLLHPLSVQDPK